MTRKLIILCIVFSACSKSSEPEDKELPVIQLTAPTNNQVFTAGQTVAITGMINDNGKLAEVHSHIYNNTTGQLLIDINRFPDAGSYSLNESFQAQAGIQYKIQILAVDKSANQAYETVFVTAN